MMKSAAILLLALTPVFAPKLLAQKWKIQYFYDQDRDNLTIEDLAFPSAERGIAVGTIADELGRGKARYTAILTSDGGAHWTLHPLAEHPRSIFFLDDSTGWLVTDEGFWFTQESGRSWKRIAPQIKPDKKVSEVQGGLISRVWFLDPKHGFAIGAQKSVYESKDGGLTWKPLVEAAQPTGNPSFTSYTHIYFDRSKAGSDGPKYGVIFGVAIPPRRDDPRLPEWMEPDRALRRRPIPTLTLLLKTSDGGVTWKSDTAPLFGEVSSVHIAGDIGLSVHQYGISFEVPSEVYRMDEKTGTVVTVYKDKVRIMDCVLFPGPAAFIAGVEPPGKMNTLPIPGKIHVLTTTNWNDWIDMPVDYKANARVVMMAGTDTQHLWLATDTGMILHLEP